MDGRYDRQVRLQEIGPAGQQRIGRSVAVVAGLGALGSVSAELLARAGVGTLRLVDRDFVERSNLQRQLLYDDADAGCLRPKAQAAAARLQAINPEIRCEPVVEDIHAGSIERIIAGATVVLDGLDNFHTRALLNEACVKHGIPWIHGAALSLYGSSATIVPGVTACLHCLLPPAALTTAMPLTCDTVGVLGPVSAMVGCWQACEALKILAGAGQPPCDALVHFDPWHGEVARLPAARSPACEVCVQHRFPLLESGDRLVATSLCGRDVVQVLPPPAFRLDLALMRDTLRHGFGLQDNGGLLKFRADGHDMVVFPDGRAMVFGTSDPGRALSLYGKYVGG